MADRARNRAKEIDTTENDGVVVLETLQEKYEKNKKVINGTALFIILAVVGLFYYFRFVKAPQQEKGMMALNSSQQYFAMDSLDRALNGDGMSPGLLKIAKKYEGTDAANLANYYIGMSYLKKGDGKNAIKYLKEFDGKGTTIGAIAKGALGDAYMESGDVKNALPYYKEATASDNDVIAATYYQRAAMAYEKNNQPEEAIEAYKKIRDEYPQSMQARDMDKNLARLGYLD